MKIHFSRNAWSSDDLVYAYSYRFTDRPVFTQFDDHIENKADPDGPGGYEYISILTPRQYGTGTSVSTHVSFEGDGAPLIVLADKLYREPDGTLRFGEYIEVVLYKNGINVWRMWYRDGKVTWKKLMGVQYPVTTGELHTLTVTAGEEGLNIAADDRTMSVYIPDMYRSFHAGINACEGINRFYDMTVDGTMTETV
ncbi:MAG: hypothetical protein J6I42_13750 [Clostridia bacterium]|nr:hypothetical protein [Clostridia bacterium]